MLSLMLSMILGSVLLFIIAFRYIGRCEKV